MNGDTSALRGALVIVLAGAGLGMVYNGMALRSHPPHGIPWIAVKEELPSLESMAPQDSVAMTLETETPATEVAPPATATAGPGARQGTGAPAGSNGARPAAARHGSPAAGGSTSPPAAAANPAPSGDAGSPLPAAPEPRRPVPLPFIPESDKPIQVQLATAKRFFDARAALFLDARDPAEYEAGHIPGAARLTSPEANTDPALIKALPVEGRPIICYCEGGACEASLDLARTLIDAGYKKVLVYMGGFPEWSAAGQPVEKGGAK